LISLGVLLLVAMVRGVMELLVAMEMTTDMMITILTQ
jgi:hypothetical protein